MSVLVHIWTRELESERDDLRLDIIERS